MAALLHKKRNIVFGLILGADTQTTVHDQGRNSVHQ